MREQADDSTLTAAESLALIDQQREQVGKRIEPDAVLVYGTWGLAWAVGFGGLYLASSGTVDLPLLAAALLFVVMIFSALAITGIHMARRFRGVRGVSSQVGAMYGWTWLAGFLAVSVVNGALAQRGLSDEHMALLGPAGPLLVVGVLYMAGGAIWRDRIQYGLGVWILAVDAVAVLAGVPGNYLVMTLAGGGGFLVAASWFALRRSQEARRGAVTS
ncbi:MAG: hypothetical protein ACRDRZ_13060 [Pseudonocardiaceae bacterium]